MCLYFSPFLLDNYTFNPLYKINFYFSPQTIFLDTLVSKLIEKLFFSSKIIRKTILVHQMKFFSARTLIFAVFTLLAQNINFLHFGSLLNMKSIFNPWNGLGALVVPCFTEIHSFSPSNLKISHIGLYWAEKFIFGPLCLKISHLILQREYFQKNTLLKLFWLISSIRICILSFWAL